MSVHHRKLLIIGICALFVAMICHLMVGAISIHLSDFWSSLFTYDSSNVNHIIARDIRIPRMVMAIIAGAGLSVAGLLMQNLFNNPLAGPNILGISTGSSLFVALLIMTGISFFSSDFGIVASALIGAFLFGIIILFFSAFSRSHASLLLIGIMIGSFSGAFVSLLQSISSAQALKVFTMWSLGSLQNVTFAQLPFIILLFSVGVFSSFLIIRILNALSLGANRAEMLGIPMKTTKIVIIGITALITGIVTAFCGPIAFVGLAVPNLVKIIFKTQDHLVLILGSLFVGAVFMLLCDILVQLLDATIHLPINAITSIIGAPFIIFIILKKLP
jgi:iron complex transport system permease protein